MPTSIEQIQEFLDEFSLNYRVDAERDAILIGFGLDPARTTFRDMDGDPGIQLVIRVLEQGEFLSIFTPQAWCVEDCPHKAAVFETLTSIQTQYKMLRFDYDPTDGEIRPNVELPLEDAELTSRQFHRLLHGVLHGVPLFDRVIRQAMETGCVSLKSLEDEDVTSPPSPAIARLQLIAAEAGGIDELERLAGGGDPEPAAPLATDAEPRADTPASPPDAPAKPPIRWILDRLFGLDDHGTGENRRAG